MDNRKFYVKTGKWDFIHIPFEELKKGDIFKIYEPDGEIVTDVDGNNVFIATGNPEFIDGIGSIVYESVCNIIDNANMIESQGNSLYSNIDNAQTGISLQMPRRYEIDWEKVTSLSDVIKILKGLQIEVSDDYEHFDELKEFLKEVRNNGKT